MPLDSLNLNSNIFFRDFLSLMKNFSQDLSGPKKPCKSSKPSRNERTIGYLALDFLEKLAICVVSMVVLNVFL